MGPEDTEAVDDRTDEQKAEDAERVHPGPRSQARRESQAQQAQQDD